MKLSSKIVTIFLIVLLGTILVMSMTFYFQAKDFYKEQLTKQLEHRLSTHADSIASHFQMETIIHVLKMEQEDTANFLLFDEKITPIAVATPVEEKNIIIYQEWIQNQVNKGIENRKTPITEYIEALDQPIPHIWSMQPIYVQNKLKGYLFIDQSTREFVTTIQGIIKLVAVMSIIIFFIALLLILYLSNVLARPLAQMGKVANEIARGNFNAVVLPTSDDEVGALARDIEQMAFQLKRYQDTRKEFLSQISHDLRTPLTYVKGYASIMKDSGTQFNEEEWKKHAKIIHKQATRMELLVQDLFELAKLEEGSITLEYETIHIYPWLKEIEESYVYKLKEDEITLKVVCNDEQLTGTFDKKRMEQVIINLLENSIRYTERGGTIIVAAKQEKDRLYFEVTDSGKGIPKEDLPYVFERFYRVDKSRSSNGGGSGLGLSIVKQIVNLHHGQITVDSEEGKGTTFQIYLPKVGE